MAGEIVGADEAGAEVGHDSIEANTSVAEQRHTAPAAAEAAACNVDAHCVPRKASSSIERNRVLVKST